MPKKRDKWVIDADIVRSAGKSEHPRSKSCRLFLQEIKNQENCYLCMDSTLSLEWHKHKSVFSIRWYASMVAKKRIIHIKESPFSFEEKIKNSDNLTKNQKKAALKDVHLINIATKCNKKIASGDDTAKNIYIILSNNNTELKKIIWLNPIIEHEAVISYLKNKHNLNRSWYLSQSNRFFNV